MQVPVFDLTRQYKRTGCELEEVARKVMAGGHYVLGDHVRALESEIAAYCGAVYGIGVASGSDALNLALMALGVGPGDEVIVPAFTFFATAGAVSRTGAVPVFADIDPISYNLDPESFASKITRRTKAVIAVHLYGNPADMGRIMPIARGHGIKVIEDAAQAIGAEFHGTPVGALGDLGTLSFFPTKNLGAVGDAGMVLTNDATLNERVRMLRVHGAPKKYFHVELGYNSRLDELQAALLRIKFKYLDEWTAARQSIAQSYTRLLEGMGLQLPIAEPGHLHVFHQYTVSTSNRDALQHHLHDRSVGSAIYYPTPLHLLPVFASLGGKLGDLPVSERSSRQVLSLPMFPELRAEEMEYVAGCIAELEPTVR